MAFLFRQSTFSGRNGSRKIVLEGEIILYFVFFTDLLQYLAIGK